MDLKSQNILLNRDQTVAKIADVGLSRGLQSSISNLSVGTLEYSAPEVLLGRYCNEKVGMGIHSVGMLLECVQCVCTLDTWPIMVLASNSMLLTFSLLRPLRDASGGYDYLCGMLHHVVAVLLCRLTYSAMVSFFGSWLHMSSLCVVVSETARSHKSAQKQLTSSLIPACKKTRK